MKKMMLSFVFALILLVGSINIIACPVDPVYIWDGPYEGRMDLGGDCELVFQYCILQDANQDWQDVYIFDVSYEGNCSMADIQEFDTAPMIKFEEMMEWVITNDNRVLGAQIPPCEVGNSNKYWRMGVPACWGEWVTTWKTVTDPNGNTTQVPVQTKAPCNTDIEGTCWVSFVCCTTMINGVLTVVTSKVNELPSTMECGENCTNICQ